MLIRIGASSLPFFEALASETRLEIVRLLAEGDMHIKALAQAVGISSPMMLRHVQKLVDAGIVKTRMVNRNGSLHKVCTLLDAEYRLEMPARASALRCAHAIHIPVGHYTDIEAHPTCGLVSHTRIIGQLDDPRYFLEPERMEAEAIWFTEGFVEYSIPNHLTRNQRMEELEISFEISSEAPRYKDDWPSDIQFSLNGVALCQWTSPGDFGERRGFLTPAWWQANQYGLLKLLRVTDEGTYLDGARVSDVTLDAVLRTDAMRWLLRFTVLPGAGHAGGLTLYGSRFGNHAQGIVVRTYYTKMG